MLSNQEREDLLVTAIEGGSNYWAIFQDLHVIRKEELITPYSVRAWQFIEAGHKLDIFDAEDSDDLLGFVTMTAIENGEKLMEKEAQYHYRNIQDEAWDAETADVWLQMIVFGEIIFG